jgi:hypothetical protein
MGRSRASENSTNKDFTHRYLGGVNHHNSFPDQFDRQRNAEESLECRSRYASDKESTDGSK